MTAPHLVIFLHIWSNFGEGKNLGKGCHELISEFQKRPLILSIDEGSSSMTIEGYTSEHSWQVIEQFSYERNGEVSSEGEIIEANNEHSSPQPSIIASIVSILTLLSLVIILPFTIVYAISKFVWQTIISKSN